MKLFSKHKKLNQSGFDHVMLLVGFVVLFAMVGTYLLLVSRAASWTGELQLGYDKALCMNDNNSSRSNGTTIGIYACGKFTSEQWTISKYSNGQFQLKNGMGVCADDWAYGVTTASKTAYLRTYTCQSNNGSEFWYWNGHALENPYSHGCINDPAYSTANGKGLIIYPCSGTPSNEQWFEAALGSVTSSKNECQQEGGNVSGNGCYFWGQGLQDGITATGAQVTMSATNPRVGSQDYHADSEMQVLNSNGDNGDAVEVCAMVEAGMTKPILFIDYWKSGKIYDYTGFVPVAGAPIKNLGNLPTTGAYTIAIKFVSSQWQVYYNGREVGYFPLSIWGNFNKVQSVAVYGETEGTATKQTTSQMGNGVLGNKPNSAYFSNYSLIGSSNKPNLSVAGPSGAAANVFKVGYITATGFHYGGPGF